MSGALISFCVMAVSVRALAGNLSIFEILTIRSGFGVLTLGTILAFSPMLRRTIVTRRIGLHLLRNSTHYAGQYMWALSLTLLPLATVFTLEFTMPAWTMLLATLVLGERMTPSRIGAVVLGLVGVLIILRPGVAAFQPAALLVLTAAFAYAVSMINTKQLTNTEASFAIIFWMNVMQLPMSLAGSALDFPLRLTSADLLPVIGIGVSGVSSHYCLSNAFRAGDASVVVPLDFLRIPLIAWVGWWIYSETVDIFVIAGALTIVSGVIWNLRAESRPILPPVARRPAA
ncbi:MAG: EamA family transporter [Rhizobiales bacterium]|nr:EamA family transporter [Hyphomicrobiales bacterium]